MLLPDEAPTVATLIDVDALREENPEFYADGQNGDVLLIFTKKAILYREVDNIIVNVAPVFIEPAASLTDDGAETTDDTGTETTDDTGTEDTEPTDTTTEE